MSTTRRLETERERMVGLIRQRGVQETHILDAFRAVPRHAFVGSDLEEFAYEDAPLPIGSGQTVSQPYMVALMVQDACVRPGEKVLEVGTGSGYAAAVYAEIARDVYTIERYADLADTARTLLDRLGYDNIHVRHGDGTTGWRDEAPFDAIIVAAGGPQVPESLKRQLQIGGRLVVPVGETPRDQVIVRVTRLGEEEWRREELGAVRFVPLVGEEGWREEASTRPEAKAKAPMLTEGDETGSDRDARDRSVRGLTRPSPIELMPTARPVSR
ncbi:MAG: protein-L-isoaspartate(D-aspartate) O-methyltransferase [Euryarchaeota archaeon]|nr:protein-L-isoaspartate(D-aspartate) O-methyltransferase [Euryarchaeota archaeon]